MSFSDTRFDSFLSHLFALPLLLLLPWNPVGAVGAVGVGYCPCLGSRGSRASHRSAGLLGRRYLSSFPLLAGGPSFCHEWGFHFSQMFLLHRLSWPYGFPFLAC